MGGVAQRRIKLGGTWYDRGAVVPDEMVTARTVNLGLVAAAATGDLEQTKAELAEAVERAEAAEARVAELEAAAAGGQSSRPPKSATKARTSGTDDTGGDAGGE